MKITRMMCLGLVGMTLAGTGCAGMSHTAKGAGVGGLVGTGIGAAAGSTTGNTGGGALVGGAIGTLMGGLIGNDIDQSERRHLEHRLAQAEARPSTPPLGITDVIQMTQNNVGDDVIINQIRTSGSGFQLSPADIQLLKQNQVSDRVILEMQNSRPRNVVPSYPSPPAIVREEIIYRPVRPVYVHEPIIIHERPCPRPPSSSFNFHYIHRR